MCMQQRSGFLPIVTLYIYMMRMILSKFCLDVDSVTGGVWHVLQTTEQHLSQEIWCVKWGLLHLHQTVVTSIACMQMHFQGWTWEHCEYLRVLWRHAVMYEELYGYSACTENVKYSLHMPDDIVRHSTLDNYWGWLWKYIFRGLKKCWRSWTLCEYQSTVECSNWDWV